MRCPRCGRECRADALFCDGCGERLQACGPSVDAPSSCLAAPCEHFVGRAHELALLEQGLTRALAGSGSIAALAGEPGIGKSHTARMLARRAAARGMDVLWGHCNEEPGAPPYWPWRQLLRGWMDAHDEAARHRVLQHAASPLAEILPDLAEPSSAGSVPVPMMDPAQTRFRLFDAITGFWKRAAVEQPLLLVLDDLHWADASSLRLLEFIAPDLVASRVLLLFTYRDIELSRQHALSETLGDLARHPAFERLRLTGLGRDHTLDMMRLAGGGSVPPALADTIHRHTEGNPLFVAEMTRLLVQEQVLGTAAPRRGIEALNRNGVAMRCIPEGVRDVIGRRLNRLSAAANHVLDCASVIGRDFDVGLLCRVIDAASEEQCTDALEEALQSRVIETLDEPGHYRFGHALFRETLYDEIPPPRRSRLHLKIGRAIEAGPDDDTPSRLAVLAHHYAAALPGGDATRAIEYARRAGESADALLAHEEAARYYRLALQAMEIAGGPGASAAARCRMLNALGEAQTRAGEYLQALEAFDQAARMAVRLGDAAELARAALGYEMGSWCPGLPGISAARLLREALAALSPQDRTTEAQLLSALARALIFSGEEGQAMKVHQQAVSVARRCADPGTLAATLLATQSARWNQERIVERMASAEEAMQIAAQQGDRMLMFSALAWRMFDTFELGDMETWRPQIERYERGADELRQPFFRYIATSSRTMHALFEGRFDEAEQLAERTFRIGDRMPGMDAAGVLGVQMFTLRREQGRLQEVAPLVRRFVKDTPQRGVWRPGLALIYVELGQLDAARAEFECIAEQGFEALPRDGVWVASLVYLVLVCVALDDAARAAALYRLLAPYRGHNLLVGTAIACFGAADAFLGMLASAMGQWQEAQTHFQAAIAMNARQKARPALAHARLGYARMLLARNAPGDLPAAQTLLKEAASEADALGMRALSGAAERVQSMFRAAGEVPHPAGLSQREAQVLRLVAAGKCNREIARELFVSPNTIANHVRSILSKTHSANRAGAAAFAIRNRLLEEQGQRAGN